MIIFAVFYFRISELLGTKKSLWFLGVPHLVSWIIVLFAVSKWAFYAARFAAGIGDAVFFSAGPPYIGEITSPKVRGTWAFLPIFTVYLGSTIITALGKTSPSLGVNIDFLHFFRELPGCDNHDIHLHGAFGNISCFNVLSARIPLPTDQKQ